MESTESTDVVPVLMVAYDNPEQIEVDYDGENPVVENHDELVTSGETHDIIRGVKKDTAKEYALCVLTPNSSLWCDAVAEIEQGEEISVSDLETTP